MKFRKLGKLKRELERVSDLTLAQFLVAVLEEINGRGANLKTFVPALTEKE